MPIEAIFIFAPLYKIFCRRARRTVKHLFWFYGQHQLSIFEQLRDIFGLHISDVLRNALHNIHAGFFTFNNDDRDTVTHNYDVRTRELPVCSLDSELLGNLPDIIFGTLKIYIFQIKRFFDGLLFVYDYSLFDAYTERQEIVNFFTRHRKPLQQRHVKFLNGSFYRLVRKRSLETQIGIMLASHKLYDLVFKQHVIQRTSFQFRFASAYIRVSHFFEKSYHSLLTNRSFVENSVIQHIYLLKQIVILARKICNQQFAQLPIAVCAVYQRL